jgi:hypothetical protein
MDKSVMGFLKSAQWNQGQGKALKVYYVNVNVKLRVQPVLAAGWHRFVDYPLPRRYFGWSQHNNLGRQAPPFEPSFLRRRPAQAGTTVGFYGFPEMLIAK